MNDDTLRQLAEIEDDDASDALECLVDETDELGAFLHGRCHLMAVALHEASGLPIHAFVDGDGAGGAWIVHAFVMDGEDAIDVCGRRSTDDVLAGFDWTEPELTPMSAEEVLRWGEGRKSLSTESRRALRDARAVVPHILRISGRTGERSPTP